MLFVFIFKQRNSLSNNCRILLFCPTLLKVQNLNFFEGSVFDYFKGKAKLFSFRERNINEENKERYARVLK